MGLIQSARRVFDDRPWAAHLYVTDRCNLDCHYCNERDNDRPHPATADLKRWMRKIRELGAVRLGLQGGEPLLHPDIVELVRYASRELHFSPVSMSTNAFALNKEMLRDLEEAGLASVNVSIDRVTPTASTRKSLRSIRKKLGWFADSKVGMTVAGVLFEDSVDEMRQVIDYCVQRGIPVHARLVHDDLIGDRELRSAASRELLMDAIDYQAKLKGMGHRTGSSWRLIRHQRDILQGKTPEWECVAGYKYFFVSAAGEFWPCSQVRTDRNIMDITPEDLLGARGPKDCQPRCGVYCVINMSLLISHPARHLSREFGGRLLAGARGMLPRPHLC